MSVPAFCIFMHSKEGLLKGGVYAGESGGFLRGKSDFAPGKVLPVNPLYYYADNE